MNDAPITGTTGTDSAPPAVTPAPYSRSHVPTSRSRGAVGRQRHGEDRAGDERRRERQRELPTGPRDHRQPERARLPRRERQLDHDRRRRGAIHTPIHAVRRCLTRGHEGRDDGDGADRHDARAGDRRERPGSLHRLPDVGQVVERAVVERAAGSFPATGRMLRTSFTRRNSRPANLLSSTLRHQVASLPRPCRARRQRHDHRAVGVVARARCGTRATSSPRGTRGSRK